MTYGRKPPPKPAKRDNKVAIIVGVVVLAAGWGIAHYVVGDHSDRKRVIETVQIKILPPPPPPKVEPPPPPPKLVEQKIQPPVEKLPKQVDEPPPGPLALDAKGGPGSDSFGLGGRPGGSDFLANGNGTRFGHYAVMIKNLVDRLVHDDEKLNEKNYSVSVRLHYSPAGKVDGVTLLHSTGDREIDERLRQVLASMPGLPEAPPSDMPSINLRIKSRSATDAG